MKLEWICILIKNINGFLVNKMKIQFHLKYKPLNRLDTIENVKMIKSEMFRFLSGESVVESRRTKRSTYKLNSEYIPVWTEGSSEGKFSREKGKRLFEMFKD